MTQKRNLSKRSTEIKKAPEGKKPGENPKALKDFLASEEGFVSKDTVLKIGLATVSGVSMMAGMAAAQTVCARDVTAPEGYCNHVHCNHSSHQNDFATPVNGNDCPMFQPTHTHDNTHTSHCSY